MVAIKLGLSNNGKAPDFYRRVTIDANNSGIEALKRHAVVLFQGNETEATAVDLNTFAVTLFYVDSDGDRVLICNESDLVEAIEEGKNELSAVIKVHATVVPSAHPRSQATQTFAPATTETGTEPSPATVVDALADLVHSVAVTAQAGVEAAAQAAQEAQRENQKALQAEARKNLQCAKIQLKRAKATSKEQIKAASRQVKDSVRAAKVSAATSKDALKKTIMDQQDVVAREMNDLAAKVTSVVSENNAPETPPFIHGRHTCDLCLTSPIIGPRFHATNLPDYDLCGTCHENYQGSDITFAEAQLDRDRGLQKRWLSKYARMVQINNRSGRRHGSPGGGRPHHPHRGGGRCHPRRPPHHGPPHHHPRGPPHHHGGPPHVPPPPHFRLHRGGPPPPPHGPPHTPHWAEPGCALPYVNSPEAGVTAVEDPALAEAIRRSLTDNAPEKVEAETVASDAEEEDSVAEATGKTEEVSTEEEEDVKEEEDFEEEEDVEEEVVAETEAVAEKREIVLEDADMTKDVEGAAEETKKSTIPKVTKTNESFESDALDSGSVAQFMGETLDRFSEAIDSLNSEVGGATIVDGETNDDGTDDSSKDSWSVVEDQQMSHDEGLARAAVTLGSALFESDNNIASSTSSSSSAISSITSVPSEMPSLVPSVAQTERWAAQLAQLHELGMNDDAKYVEVMEMLAAANIGSGEDEEITVTQVLNHTM